MLSILTRHMLSTRWWSYKTLSQHIKHHANLISSPSRSEHTKFDVEYSVSFSTQHYSATQWLLSHYSILIE